MTYKDTKQTQERYAIKKSSKWKTAGSVLVASLIFGSSVVLNEIRLQPMRQTPNQHSQRLRRVKPLPI